MTTTTTPQDLLAAITRAIAEGASADERRAGRHACIVLASALGEPGAPMAPTPPSGPRPRIDAGLFLDLAITKMRAFLDEQAAAQPGSPASPAPAPAADGTSSTATPAPTPAPTTAPTSRSRPAPALRIPLVGGFAPKR